MTIAKFYDSTIATQNKFILDTSGDGFHLGINPNDVTGGSSSIYGTATTTTIITTKGTYTEVVSSVYNYDPATQTFTRPYYLSLSFGGQTIFTFGNMPGDPDLQGVAYMGYVFSGNDQLTGGSGDDKLYGWNGNDSITGSSGNDIIDGGNGTDYAYFSDKYGDCLITFNGVVFNIATKTQGVDTLKNVEFAVFSDYTYNLSDFYTPATYKLTASNSSVNESSDAIFNLVTTKVPAGTTINYTISGVSAADLTSGKLTGTTVVGADGKSTITIGIKADNLTEGDETLIVNLSGVSASTTIKDTSISQFSTETHTLSVIVNKGILAAEAVILKDLIEKIVLSNGAISNHTVQYGNTVFDYSQIDSLITTVTSDGNFTSEFRKEIADLLPAAANFSYQDTVKLVGTANIDNVILYVSGADGNFVG